MILLIDNYDSFTFNLYQYLCELGADVTVRRNDAITVDDVRVLAPERIVVSPGPCTPREAGVSVELIRAFAAEVPILGVCLGHQSIGVAFGARVVHAPCLMHGKTSRISHDGRGVFAGLPNQFVATRYHSLVVDEATLPDDLEVTARSEDDVVMGIRHRRYDVEGVQFHPESILTAVGKDLLANFVNTAALVVAAD
ncbi:MAG TPA: aminodeoxychorismate/anthranilate synthase component II [Thermomicrobiaceae bacterium]|nr:aminodeoxychorismate/anthranilate synthase component II [Thermomicrobiaceae bacterium]